MANAFFFIVQVLVILLGFTAKLAALFPTAVEIVRMDFHKEDRSSALPTKH